MQMITLYTWFQISHDLTLHTLGITPFMVSHAKQLFLGAKTPLQIASNWHKFIYAGDKDNDRLQKIVTYDSDKWQVEMKGDNDRWEW